jgi:hypothetical protein
MEKRQERTVHAFESVLLFLERHPVVPEPPLLGRMRKSLRASIDRIARLGVQQNTASQLRGNKVDHHRKALRRDRMMPLVRIARPLLRFAPGADRVLRVPHARADAVTVANAAIQMAKALKPHRRLLASAGYSPTFLAEFQHEALELGLAAKRAAVARQTQSKVTRDMAREFKKAMQTVTIIEGLVLLHLGSDKSSMRYWKQRRRVGARIGRPPQRKTRSAPPAIATPPSPAAAELPA